MEEQIIREYTFNEILANLFSTKQDYLDDCIDIIKSNNSKKKILTQEEEHALDVFEKLYKVSGTLPSVELFKESCSDYHVDFTFKTNDILGATILFVNQRKNHLISKSLINESVKVATSGVTPDISKNISNMLISDTVNIKYENISDKIINIYESEPDNSGIKTGILPVDDMTGGLRRGQVSVIAGFTGMGKSITAVSVMYSALKQGYNVCYLSLELSAEHLMYNLLSRHSLDMKFAKKIEHKKLKFRDLSEEDWNYTKETILPDLKTLPGKYYILDEQDIEAYNQISFNSKLQEIENLCMEETGKGLDLIIVDHIQMLAYSNDSDSENRVINRWCNYFRSQCLDFLKSKRKIHVVLVSQVNRQGYQAALKHQGMYNLTSLKEANEIETCASVIIGVFSDPSLIVSGQVKVGVLKNRDGDRSSDAYICPADFAHQLVGGEGRTINDATKIVSVADVGNMLSNINNMESTFNPFVGDVDFDVDFQTAKFNFDGCFDTSDEEAKPSLDTPRIDAGDL